MRTSIKKIFSLYHYIWAFGSALFFRFPSRRVRVIGVTGTKGKSTTVALLAHIFNEAGLRAAHLSTVSVSNGIQIRKNTTGNSMPGRFYIQKFLRTAVQNQCAYAFLEVTSQGTVQHRHKHILWAGAMFLDIHPEHIESHGSFTNYLNAKISFFRYARTHSSRCVFYVHTHDAHAQDFIQVTHGAKCIQFAVDDFHKGNNPALPGAFNAINIAGAYAVAREEGITHETIMRAIKTFGGVAGRMECVQREPYMIFVDYAHTPDSLREVYTHMQTEVHKTGGKLICVLGSAGGGRDRWKRPEMGKIAGTMCDTVILTNEDPFDENPMDIIRAVYEGVKVSERYNETQTYCIEDRTEAIRKALSCARGGDVVVCTGKGSESSIRVAHGKKISWNERKIIETLLKENTSNGYYKSRNDIKL